jgi:hypothetical protein
VPRVFLFVGGRHPHKVAIHDAAVHVSNKRPKPESFTLAKDFGSNVAADALPDVVIETGSFNT